MNHHEREVRRERREWLLRVCSQAQQRQQVGPGGRCVQRLQATGVWRPGEGWVGQNSPESALPAEDAE
ncbi:hypothetical protein [Ramlibacter alkalitolerans]|uniref:Uncharacterized protein n=1 Tax=Ramlibacter alkalitolerans TaxID=2039631 RepID=A0ABS1JQR5_9BURK|nr:hypothetical protein [Ramlibacter alkalitolerans]MBL0426543.1 hypothetical protein [Ramlibacter alkalitolerans]